MVLLEALTPAQGSGNPCFLQTEAGNRTGQLAAMHMYRLELEIQGEMDLNISVP